MKNTPIDYAVVDEKVLESRLANVGKASIREIRSLINSIERATSKKYIRMEMGVPGLPANKVGIEAEIAALRGGCASVYPSIEGIPELKDEISRFIRLFINLDVPARCCIPVTGSTSGSFICWLTAGRMHRDKDTTLFLDPGFPVHKQQLNVLGLKHRSLDVYNYRGEALREKLESILAEGGISTILYSNPNNPSWICFKESELRIIGELATKYGVVVLEDLAYFTMDFRQDYSVPGQPPYQPSVAHYTDNYILLISSSKVFSYAGQRIGVLAISNTLYDMDSEDLTRYYVRPNFGHSLVYGAAYGVSAGVAHSTQYGLAAMLKAVNDGSYCFRDDVIIYGKRAKALKQIFTSHGFSIVYDTDIDEPIADGFYFTVSYPGMTGEELIREFLYYGISAISLSNTGSERREGIRACVSHISEDQFPELDNRLKLFHEHHQGGR